MSTSTLTRELTICNKLGLHARAAARLVQTATGFECEITIRNARRSVNAKSIMGLLMLAAGIGTTITVEATGADAAQAVDAIDELVQSRFGEES